MTRIQQRGPDDCAVATLAMLLGVSYEEARERVGAAKLPLCETHLDAAVAEAGYAYVRRYHHDPLRNARREAWPPAPFASRHWALVVVAGGGHAVAVDADGLVLDPYAPYRTSLSHPDYLEVHHVTGLWRAA